MGDTSSGKSSVLSALSGITFPSAEKLCTRCPTTLMLTRAQKFECTIYLQRYRNPDDRGTIASVSCVEEITAEIEKLTQQLVDEGQSISDDSIIIKCKGPKMPDFTLTDLPGIVRNVDDGEDEGMIDRIRSLIHRYMTQERTIILAVHPADVDLHNSEVLNAAKKADPEGVRTICVISKPDKVGEENQSILELLSGKKFKLQLGFHAMMCRSAKALKRGDSIEIGIKNEQTFFDISPAWKDVDRSCFGTNELKVKLVDLLEVTVASALPSVIAEISENLDRCQQEVAKMGEPMDTSYARRSFYNSCLETYLSLMRSAACGDYESLFFKDSENKVITLMSEWNDDFADKMREKLYVEKQQKPEYEFSQSGETVWLEALEDENADHWIPVKGKWINHDKIECGVQLLSVRKLIDLTYPDFRFPPKVDLSFIKDTIKQNRTGELRIFPSYSVFVQLFRNHTKEWTFVSEELAEKHFDSFCQVSTRAIDSVANGKLSRFLNQKTSQVFKSAIDACRTALSKLLQLESNPSTLNHYLEDTLKNFATGLCLTESLNYMEATTGISTKTLSFKSSSPKESDQRVLQIVKL